LRQLKENRQKSNQ